ncbi:hypothetical protein L3Y34_011472 [Caenorhabditis briggsae]|uniref:Uncharacterized protein n=1 Tax=Caenorhabditis briggsae TaxID=6238 RepID=A0AAE8ZRS9_CAEBR|nr:hypothetical protein L3Y34_011472 [Caenorhabditis briggsae]
MVRSIFTIAHFEINVSQSSSLSSSLAFTAILLIVTDTFLGTFLVGTESITAVTTRSAADVSAALHAVLSECFAGST